MIDKYELVPANSKTCRGEHGTEGWDASGGGRGNTMRIAGP